jgi:hypothetical protein
MSLIPIEHAHRLASPAEAEAFFRGLRQRRVSVRGFHTTDPQRIEALVAAADPKREHTISLRGGTLGDAARAALAELCGSAFWYLDLRTTSASLRVWPKLHTWVDRLSGHTSTDWFETKSINEALDRFNGICGQETEIVQGHITGLTEQTRAPLLGFLRASLTEIHVVLDVRVQTARLLTEQFPGQKLDWQSEMIQVDLPAGRIHGCLKTPKVDERHRRKWQARVDKALRRAKLV